MPKDTLAGKDRTPIAYVYNGLTHCIFCAEFDYGVDFIPSKTKDSRGEPIGVIENWEADYMGAILCETPECGIAIA